MQRLLPVLLALALVGCDYIPDWVAGPKKEIKRAAGERIDVVAGAGSLKADSAAEAVEIDIPEQHGLDSWPSRNNAMLVGHVGLTGIERADSARIGAGNGFSRAHAPAPIVTGGMVIAMDAAGIISAHDAADIEKILWVSKAGEEEDADDVLGGGLAVHEGIVFATTGFGRLFALDSKTGKRLWKTNVGAPVRGAPACGAGIVVVLTADDQTLAFDETTGTPRWSQRGIREAAGYFSSTSPIISDDGIVIAPYSSGELFALRAESGSELWSDNMTSTDKTNAAAIFSGIDADPVVQDGVVLAISSGGLMQASALLNGRPIWEQRVGSHMTPWPAGNAVFVLTANHELAALLKRDGAVRWSVPMGKVDARGKDITPPLFGPILAGNAVLVITGDGTLSAFRPQDGARLSDYEIDSGIVTAPVIAGGALYLVDQSARLHKYY